MTTTECGVGAASASLSSADDGRPPPLRPLTTGTYLPAGHAGTGTLTTYGHLVAYAVPLLVVWALAVRWFAPGRFFAGGATPPFVLDNLRTELWSAWSHHLSGGGSSSYPVGRTLELGALTVGDAVGLGAPAVQMLTTALAAVYAAWAVSFLACSLVRPIAAGVAALLAVVNPYTLATLPDHRPLVAVGLAASLAGIVRAAGAGRRVAPLALVLATLPFSLLATEPLVLATVVVWLAVCGVAVMLAGGAPAVVQLLRFALWAVPLTLLVQVWWLVPAVQVLAGDRDGIELGRRGLLTPVAAALLIPVIALSGAVVLDRWLRRADRARRSGGRPWRVLWIEAPALVAVVAVLAVPLPLWTGDVAGSRESVDVPDDWYDVASTVNRSSIEGKALLLPLARADGRITTNWGYSGVDDVPRQLLRRPVLQRSSDDLFRLPTALDQQLRTVGHRLGDRDTAGASRMLDELGVSHLVIRRDVATDATPLVATAAELRGWRPARHSAVADVFERVRPAPLVTAGPTREGEVAPTVAWRRRDAARYDLRIRGADGAFLLMLAETFGSGWRLEGLPRGWTAEHGVAHGYANGWRVDGRGPADLRLVHDAGEVPASAWAVISFATVAGVALASLVLPFRSRRAKRARRAAGPA